jgi:hypothetical protein
MMFQKNDKERMDKVYKKVGFMQILAIMSVLASCSYAAVDMERYGSAKAAGLGGNMVSAIANPDSMFYNPAAVEFSQQHHFMGSYGKYTGDITRYIYGYTYKISESSLIGLGGNSSVMTGTDESSTKVLIVSYAQKMNDSFIIGLSAGNTQFLSKRYSENGFGLDLGAYYVPLDYISLGLAFRNILKMRYRSVLGTAEVAPTGAFIGTAIAVENPLIQKMYLAVGRPDINVDNNVVNVGMEMKLFDVDIWKGWSYDRRRYLPWVESIGIGLPLFIQNLRLEYADSDNNYNYSLVYEL